MKNQNRRADIDSIHKQLVKTHSITIENLTIEDLLKKVHGLETEGKIEVKIKVKLNKGIVDAFAEIT